MSTTYSPEVRPALTPAQIRTRANTKNLALWTLQGWAAMFFIAAGYAKLTESSDNLVALLHWPALVSPALVQGVGLVEVVLALGLIAPLASWKLGRWPLLISAAGLIAMEAVMLVVHAVSADIGLAAINAILLAITIPVLLGRRVSR